MKALETMIDIKGTLKLDNDNIEDLFNYLGVRLHNNYVNGL